MLEHERVTARAFAGDLIGREEVFTLVFTGDADDAAAAAGHLRDPLRSPELVDERVEEVGR